MSVFSQNYTLNNGGLTDLNKVIFDAVFKTSDLFNTCTAMNGVKNGEKADYVTKMSHLGWAGRGCNPTYKKPTIGGREQTWELGDWQMPLHLCYDDLKDTIAMYGIKSGTNADDLSSTDFYDKIFNPLLKDAIERMYWRMAWFGDKGAKLKSAGGVLKAGTDTTLFSMADGLWKKIFAATATNHHTAVAANNATTYDTTAKQIAALRASGVALGIIEQILADASSLIKGGVIMCTKNFADALKADYRREYKATIPFMQVAEGVNLPTYDGNPILVVEEWDDVISEFENDGTVTNNPIRVLFANPDNFLVGTSDKNTFAELTVGFDDKARENYTYAASNIGTLVDNPELVQAAY